MRAIGLDIGGAHLKAAGTHGLARTRAFALWKQPERLAEALRALLDAFPPAERYGLTMTGELCDCFSSSSAGVRHILDAASAVLPAERLRIYERDGRFLTPLEAREQPLACAAVNWLALATWAGRLAPAGRALLIDLGSTTTDLIPLEEGVPVPAARTDPERLVSGELVYTGVRRTPACALLGPGGAAEFFATTHDVYLVLERVRPDPDDCDTADGRPATREHAQARLARMLCGDRDMLSATHLHALARRIALIQAQTLEHAIRRVTARQGAPHALLLSGSGEFVVRDLVASWGIPIVSLGERIGPDGSTAACAWAVAQLAAEEADGCGW